jgi:hypothetical protein
MNPHKGTEESFTTRVTTYEHRGGGTSIPLKISSSIFGRLYASTTGTFTTRPIIWKNLKDRAILKIDHLDLCFSSKGLMHLFLGLKTCHMPYIFYFFVNLNYQRLGVLETAMIQ